MRARICLLPLLSRSLELSGLPVIDVQMDFKEQRSNIYEANELAELITSGGAILSRSMLMGMSAHCC